MIGDTRFKREVQGSVAQKLHEKGQGWAASCFEAWWSLLIWCLVQMALSMLRPLAICKWEPSPITGGFRLNTWNKRPFMRSGVDTTGHYLTLLVPASEIEMSFNSFRLKKQWSWKRVINFIPQVLKLFELAKFYLNMICHRGYWRK